MKGETVFTDHARESGHPVQRHEGMKSRRMIWHSASMLLRGLADQRMSSVERLTIQSSSLRRSRRLVDLRSVIRTAILPVAVYFDWPLSNFLD